MCCRSFFFSDSSDTKLRLSRSSRSRSAKLIYIPVRSCAPAGLLPRLHTGDPSRFPDSKSDPCTAFPYSSHAAYCFPNSFRTPPPSSYGNRSCASWAPRKSSRQAPRRFHFVRHRPCAEIIAISHRRHLTLSCCRQLFAFCTIRISLSHTHDKP